MIVVPDCMGSPEVARSFHRHLAMVEGVRIHEAAATDTSRLIDHIRGARTVVHFFAGAALTGEVLRAARPSLIVVAGPVGRSVDMPAAREVGARVYHTPGLAAPAVAEYTLAVLLSLSRRIPQAADSVRSGQWAPLVGREVSGFKLGVIGLGRVGTRVAELAAAVGMEVAAWSPRLGAGAAAPAHLPVMALDALLARSDAVSLHLRLGPRTWGLIGAAELGLLPRGSFLVNTARAALVDMAALRAALAEGKLGGAALDVHDAEPLPAGDLLRSHPHVLATPHMAWMTEQAIDRFVAAATSFVKRASTDAVREVT